MKPEQGPHAGSRPALIIVSGLPGSGKTTLAKRIATERPAVRFSPDDWLEALGFGTWDDKMRHRVEQLQETVLRDVLGTRASVVIEWGTWKRRDRARLRDLAHSLDAQAELIFLDFPLEVLFERVTVRGTEDPPITLEQMYEWEADFQRIEAVEAASFDAFHRLES